MNELDHGNVISLTESASARIHDYLKRSGRGDSVIRIALVRSHCMRGKGFEYSFSVEDTQKSSDLLVVKDGLGLVIEQTQVPLLRGSVIDFEHSLQEGSLKVTNPNAVAKCPCGDHDIFEGAWLSHPYPDSMNSSATSSVLAD